MRLTSPFCLYNKGKKVKWSRYRPGVAHRVGRGIALLFHDHGTGRGWVVSSTPRPHFTPGKDAVPILQEAGWAPGPVWTGGKTLPHRDSIAYRPARSSVAILTELPGPHIYYIYIYIHIYLFCVFVETEGKFKVLNYSRIPLVRNPVIRIGLALHVNLSIILQN